MHTTYNSVKGDNYAKISQKVYGTEQNAALVRQSNPGVYEPIPAGLIILCPDLSETVLPTTAHALDELSITIMGERFRFWDGITVKCSVDSIDTLELTGPFEPDNADFRKVFKPFQYPPITCSIGSELIFTGTLTTVKPAISVSGRVVAAGAYSLPGVLADCCAPASMYSEDESLEFEGVDLRYIANTLLKPFGLKAVFDAPPGDVFELVSAKATEQIMPFLAKLAKQRNLVITSNVKGELIFWQSNPGGDPVAVFLKNVAGPVLSIDPDFRTQDYYSHITGIDNVGADSEGGQVTERNTRLQTVLRPFTFEATDSEGGNLETATKAKVGRMFGDAISYTVELDTWRDGKGNLWKPNTTVILESPGAMIYKPYEFLIRDVEYRRNSTGSTATLTLVIPASYRGKVPETLPWDD